MKILITGNMGYLGAIVTRELRRLLPECQLLGFDNGYFAHCLTNANYLPECDIDIQYFGDLRQFPYKILNDVDVIIHLAAISNDPMGSKYEEVTLDINDRASKLIAQEAKNRGAKVFIFASSCSMYGKATGHAQKEADALNPLTAYARSKVSMEDFLAKLAGDCFIVTSLRFATACGMSPRLRLDLVVNDFVASAVTSKNVIVLSDGTPWRPLIHVKDMSRAIAWGVARDASEGGQFLAVNVGSDDWNYQVKDLASAVAQIIPNTIVSIDKNGQPDSRSYKVDFSLFRHLGPDYQPLMTLADTIEELKEGLESIGFSDKNYRKSKFVRLEMLESHIRNGFLTADLFWVR